MVPTILEVTLNQIESIESGVNKYRIERFQGSMVKALDDLHNLGGVCGPDQFYPQNAILSLREITPESKDYSKKAKGLL